MAMVMVAMIWIIIGVNMVDIAHREIILLGNPTRYPYDFDKRGAFGDRRICCRGGG
jgi:hypothetical protein